MTLHGYCMTVSVMCPDAISDHLCYAAAQTQSLLLFADRALHTVYLRLSTVQCLASSNAQKVFEMPSPTPACCYSLPLVL